MRFLSLALLASGLGYLFLVERRNRRAQSLPWWAKNYGQMDRDWVQRHKG